METSKSLYHPNISKVSDHIAKNKNNKEKKVHDRLYDHHEEILNKKKRLQIKSIPTFTPVINKNLPNFSKEVNYNNTKSNKLKNNFLREKERKLNNSALNIYSMNDENCFSKDNNVSLTSNNVDTFSLKDSPKEVNLIKRTKLINQDLLHSLKNREAVNNTDIKLENNPLEDSTKLYKLNIRDSSPWNNRNENVILGTSNFSNLIKNFK